MSEGQVAALLLWLVLLAFSLNASLLRTLGAHPLYQHLCLGGAIVLVPLWTLRAGLHEGLEIHFLGLTSLTLLLGWRLALLAPCLTLLLLAYFGVIPLADIGWQGWLVIERSRDANDPRNVKKNFGANAAYLKSVFQG